MIRKNLQNKFNLGISSIPFVLFMTKVEYFEDTRYKGQTLHDMDIKGVLQNGSIKYCKLDKRCIFLALSAIEDLDVKLGSPAVIIEHQDPALM
jgi:hypothetical protein